VVGPTHLEGREARCSCGKTRPSPDALEGKLAFFEYRGRGSRWTDNCECGYAWIAHTQETDRGRINVVAQGKCPGFTPRGPHEFDTYYCGCRGWD
jgi:hypothetical protein